MNRNTIHGVGTFLAYAYLLRVPLLVCAAVASLPMLALPRGAAAGPLLRGLFDVADPAYGWWWWIATFALLTGTALMVAASIAFTARIIILDAHDRFGVDQLARSAGIHLVVKLAAAAAAIALIGGAWWQSAGVVGVAVPIAGFVAGGAVFSVVVMVIHRHVWDALFANDAEASGGVPTLAARILLAGLRPLVRLSPAGFVNHDGRIWARHVFAMLQLLFSALFYVGLFVVKINLPGLGGIEPRVPTLCLVLVLAMLACWALSALTFFFDRYRVPLLAILIVHGTVMSVFPWNDHFFQTVPRAPHPVASLPADAVLKQWTGRPAIVVAAAGGGIQAAAWTAHVLAGLQRDSVACGDRFDTAIAAISAVSGGAVGAMYIVDAYRGGALDPDALRTAEKAAEASSLDDVAWGVTYPDLVWTVAPFLKIASRRLLVQDRGSALEDTWKRSASLANATLDRWRADLAAAPQRLRPAVLFNATVAETGQRMLFATTTLHTKINDPGRREFALDFPDLDVQVTTAARLSSTFPYVSPAARVDRGAGFDDQYHYVDGAYYDNYGTATLIEWLDQGLTALNDQMPRRVLMLEIRSFPDNVPAAPDGKRGWIADAIQPLRTLYAGHLSGQQAQSDVDVHLLQDDYGGALIHHVSFTFPARLFDEQDDPVPALSWHLTPADRGRLAEAWHDANVYNARVAVHTFLREDDGAVSNSCISR
jgi:patatin-like phospholipase